MKVSKKILNGQTRIGLAVMFSVLFSLLLNFISANINEFDVNFTSSFIFTTLSYIGMIVFVFSVHVLSTGKVRFIDITIPVVSLYILLHYYESIYRLVLGLNTPYKHIISILFIFTIILLSIFFLKKEKFKKLYIIITISIFFLSVINFTYHQFNTTYTQTTVKIITDRGSIASIPNGKKPSKTINNIYYIIADGLGSTKGLKHGGVATTGLKELAGTLDKNGFYIANNSTSSYNLTILTLQSIFNMGYLSVHGDYTRYDIDATFPISIIPMASLHSKKTSLERMLSDFGYENFHWFGNSLIQCDKRSRFQCYEKKINSSLKKILLNLLNDHSLMAYLENSIYPRFIHKLLKKFSYQKDDAIGNLINYLSNNRAEKISNSFFFIHQMMPHPPYVTENCEVVSGSRPKDWGRYDKNNYNASIQCFNKKIKNLITVLYKKDPNAIIIIQGDHGSRFNWPKNDDASNFNQIPIDRIIETHSIFNAIKLPDYCNQYLYDKIGTVNSIRLAAFCSSSKRTPILIRDRSFFSLKIDKEEVTEVTDYMMP